MEAELFSSLCLISIVKQTRPNKPRLVRLQFTDWKKNQEVLEDDGKEQEFMLH